MRFSYYASLSKANKAIYDASDRVAFVTLAGAEGLRPIVDVLRQALEADEAVRPADRVVIQAASGRLVLGITSLLEVEPVDVRVLAVRPALHSSGELHGLYTREPGRRPEIRVWMRTLAHKRVVAFRTYLRTLLHEVCHHLDYTLLALPDSFHTQGFFNRESSLFKQLVPELVRPPRQRRSG